MLGSGSSIRFRFEETAGAALVTKYQIYGEDAQELGNLRKYTKENYASWVEFARNAGHDDVNPILVTGVDRTKDFAMMCYSDYDNGLECEFRTSASGVGPAPAWGTWKTSRPIYDNHGPQLRCPPSAQTTYSMSSGNSHVETVSDEYNQSVFIRYFGMRARKLGVPKVIKAGAGPHDLGRDSGGYDGEGSPLQTQDDSSSGSDFSSSLSDGGWGNHADSDTSVDSESDIITHNPTAVRYLSPSLVFFFIDSPQDERDDFDQVANYVFQASWN